MSNLLVVDFDSFFPVVELGTSSSENRRDALLYDWGHKESPFMMDGIWGTRAQGFIMNNLPLPDLNGEETTFWGRGWKITPGARVFYADSNACAINPTITGKNRRWDDVYLYDAHHDSGYTAKPTISELVDEGRWSCENWMVLYYAVGARLHVRYPQWRHYATEVEPTPLVRVDRAVDNGSVPDVTFDTVFICRSSAWVPPWNDIDARFDAFVAATPAKSRKIDVMPGGTTRRTFDLAEQQAQLEAVAKFRTWAMEQERAS